MSRLGCLCLGLCWQHLCARRLVQRPAWRLSVRGPGQVRSDVLGSRPIDEAQSRSTARYVQYTHGYLTQAPECATRVNMPAKVPAYDHRLATTILNSVEVTA